MSVRSHGLLAYLLLLALMYVFAKSAFLPFESYWRQQTGRTQALQDQLNKLQELQASETQAASLMTTELKQALTSGQLNYSQSQSESALVLQSEIKRALQSQAAKVMYLQPSVAGESAEFWQSRLEISFTLPASKLNGLIRSLAQLQGLGIELLSFRKPASLTSRATQQMLLEAKMTVLMPFADKALVSSLLGMTEPVHGNTTASEKADRATNHTEVAPLKPFQGLFDAAHRALWQAPSPDYYRLSAVTVLNNAEVALIANVKTNTSRRLMVGDLLDVWTVTAITATYVELTEGQRTERLLLKKQ